MISQPNGRASSSGDLLYISGGCCVYYYTYPGLQYIGDLQISDYVSGLCSDAAGDVFITQNLEYYGSGWVLEYAHEGVRPIASFSDPGARPLGCAIDPENGALAVTSYAGQSPSESGNVVIYHLGSTAAPGVYTDPDLFFYDFCAYDGRGDLFVDGQGVDLQPLIAELPRGGTALTTLTLQGLPKSFGYVGALAWDGKYLALGDFDHDVIYQLKVSGTTASVVRSTHLLHGDHVEQFSIARPGLREQVQGSLLIAPSTVQKTVFFYRYPGGGKALRAITGLDGAFGTTISKGQMQ